METKYSKSFLCYNTIKILDLRNINNYLRAGIHYKFHRGVIDRYEINLTSQRYKLFTTRKQRCVRCGLKASFWALQSGHGSILERPHLNLWGVTQSGNTRLFTKDHITPKSKGGGNTMRNYQVMCEKCNSKKGNDFSINLNLKLAV